MQQGNGLKMLLSFIIPLREQLFIQMVRVFEDSGNSFKTALSVVKVLSGSEREQVLASVSKTNGEDPVETDKSHNICFSPIIMGV